MRPIDRTIPPAAPPNRWFFPLQLIILALVLLAGNSIAQTRVESPDDEPEPDSSATATTEAQRKTPDQRRIVISIDPEDREVRIEDDENGWGKSELDELEDVMPVPPGLALPEQELREIERELDRIRAERRALRREAAERRDLTEAERLDEIKRLDEIERELRDRDLTGQVRFNFDDDEGQIVRIGRSLRIEEAEIVRTAVVMGGNMRIYGEVEDDAVVVGGNMYVEDGAVVGGDAVVVGGRLIVQPGGYIEGEKAQFGIFSPFAVSVWGGHTTGAMDLFSAFLGLVLLLFLGWIANLIIRQRLDVMAGAARHDLLRSLLVGLLIFILWVPAMVLCAITIVGIPITIVLAIALPLAAFVGFLAGCQALGERIGAGIRFERQSSLGYLFIGITAISAISLLGTALGLLGDASVLLALIFKLTGCLIAMLAATVGLGALTLTRFGGGREQTGPPPVPVSEAAAAPAD